MKSETATGVIFLLLLLFSIQQAKPQSFSYDATFKPFFDITSPSPSGGGLVPHIWESPLNGKLMLAGSFHVDVGSKRYNALLRINRNGSRDTSFDGIGSITGVHLIQAINDTAFALSSSTGGGVARGTIMIDSTGKRIWMDWFNNKIGTMKCARQVRPFFFENGSSLHSKHSGPFGSCDIFQPPDTFAHRYLIKIDSLGLWDSTFQHETNEPPRGFKAYDSSRIWVYGHPGVVVYYDSVQVDGLFRIYHDGTLDTTFKSSLLPHIDFGNYEIGETEEDGKFILHGRFLLKGDTSDHLSMARFNADGSLDTTFNNYGQNYSIHFKGEGGVGGYARTEDKGYLIGGSFDTLQGVAKNRIAKLDSNGYLQSQYLTSTGPDSAWTNFGYPYSVARIYKSAFGGYYVTGDFLKWDGQPVQPIIRLKGLLVGEEELGKGEMQKLKVETYPNPTSQNLHLRIGRENVVKEIQLFDLLGKEQSITIAQQDHWNYTLNLKELPKGIYILSLQAKDGSMVSRKVVKN